MSTFDPRTERNIKTLIPAAQEAAREFLSAIIPVMERDGITVQIISGTRTYAEQDALYAQGRSKPGPRVTNARGGHSNHNFGIAWDIGLFCRGKYLTSSPRYQICGEIGRQQGLEWGGDWKSFVDEPHYQLKTGLTLAQMRARIAAGQPLIPSSSRPS